MIKTLLLLLTIMAGGTQIISAKECVYADLSKKFDYKITTVKASDENNTLRTTKVYIRIFNKINKKQVQKITVNPEYLFETAYSECSTVKSYVTGKNQKAEVVDNDYGDLIITDFNFDGREDFALKKDSGGNGGAFYEYYTQNKFGRFKKDLFLTDKIGYFPGKIDAKNKTLVTYIHANVAGYNENVFKYYPITKKWKFLKSTYRKV